MDSLLCKRYTVEDSTDQPIAQLTCLVSRQSSGGPPSVIACSTQPVRHKRKNYHSVYTAKGKKEEIASLKFTSTAFHEECHPPCYRNSELGGNIYNIYHHSICTKP